MCLWNMDVPGGNNVKIWQKSPTPPQGHVMSVKCEQKPLDELLYHHPNFKYCTLFVSGRELQRQVDRQIDGRMIRLLDAPGRPFMPWDKNAKVHQTIDKGTTSTHRSELLFDPAKKMSLFIILFACEHTVHNMSLKILCTPLWSIQISFFTIGY